MEPYLITIPNVLTIKKIFDLRRKLVGLGCGLPDPRAKVLPHVTIVYIEEKNLTLEQNDLLVKKLSELSFSKSIKLKVKEIVNWEYKIVSLFDTTPIRELVTSSEKLFKEIRIKANEDYKNLVGNHMKVVREIKPEKVQQVLRLIKLKFPKEIIFDRVAYINKYGGEEKDILWQKKLE